MGLKLRKESSTAAISADDIHVRAGGTSGDPLSFNETAITNLGFTAGGTTTGAKNFQQYHNKFKLTTGDYFNTTGYAESFIGGTLGSISENIMAGPTDAAGWTWDSSGNEGRIYLLYANTVATGNIFYFKPVSHPSGTQLSTNYQTWTEITVREESFASQDLVRNTTTYASWSSASGLWTWNSSCRNSGESLGDIFGTSSGQVRYIQID